MDNTNKKQTSIAAYFSKSNNMVPTPGVSPTASAPTDKTDLNAILGALMLQPSDPIAPPDAPLVPQANDQNKLSYKDAAMANNKMEKPAPTLQLGKKG